MKPISAALLLAVCAGSLAIPAAAQPGTPTRVPVTSLTEQIVELTGRDFAGLQLPQAPQIGQIALSGRNVTAWVAQPSPGPAPNTTIGGPVQRCVLVGDVGVTLGDADFAAARAVAWIEALGPSARDPKVTVYQVAVYFDRVSDPASEAGSAASGDRLLVTAVVEGPTSLRGDRVEQGRPREQDLVFLAEAEQRFARHLQDLVGGGEVTAESADDVVDIAPVPGMAGRRGLVIPGLSQPYEPDSMYGDANRPRQGQSLLDGPSGERSEPLLSARGTIAVSAGEPTLLTGAAAVAAGADPGKSLVVITGGVIVQYLDGRRNRSLQLTCERAVVFLKEGELRSLASAPAEAVEGIYLEGDVVATDGQYTLRGPQIYYDFVRNQALVVDAVFWTYDESRGLPIYVRAGSLRQLATNQFQSDRVRMSTSAFFRPVLTVGVRDVTITRDAPAGRAPRTLIAGRNVTASAWDFPFFWWPAFENDSERFPLRALNISTSSSNGFAIRSRWDLFGLLNFDPGPEWDAELLGDAWFERGVGVGVDLTWDTDNAKGSIFAYTNPYDVGKDVLASGEERDHDGEFRGLFMGEHRWQISEHWTGFLELAAVSDENMVQGYFESLAQTRREFASSAYLRRLEDNTALTVLVRGNVNQFSSNEYILQSQGYDVSKFPEFTYWRVSDDVLSGIAPGILTWSHEYRASYMSMNFTERSGRELGMDTSSLSLDAFGIPDPDTNISSALNAQGLDEDWVFRADTRHELSSALDAGPVRFVPFVVGRLTFYDRSFSDFSGADGEDSQFRGWAAGGVRVSTSINRVYDEVESSLLDLHRLRHIIEPNMTAWIAGTNRADGTLPIYDDTVEGINQGTSVRGGVTQTLQTQRGGEGRWRTVDVVKWDTNIVYSADNAKQESPIGRFIDYRPEYGQLGTFMSNDLVWQATDAVAVTFTNTFDFDAEQSARTGAGLIWQLWDDTSAFTEVFYLNERDATYVVTGADFRITPKWTFGLTMTYDVQESDLQGATARFRREFPQFTLGARIGFSDFGDQLNVAVEFIPAGQDYRVARLQRLNRGVLEAGFTEAGTAGLGEAFDGGAGNTLGGGTGR